MGLFDYVRSSYPLGESFSGVCQTKDIEEYDIGGTMSQFWINPDGQLYLIDYSHTADFVELKEGDEGYSEVGLFNFQWVPNGTHGKVRPWNITKYIVIYPEQWDGEWEHWPECRIHFKDGKLQDYDHSSKGDMTELEALKAQIKVLERKVEQLERNTLYAVIENWWSDVFTVSSTDDMETCIDTLVDRIETWLPKPQSAAGSQNVYVECTVEGFNDCLTKIKGKLR